MPNTPPESTRPDMCMTGNRGSPKQVRSLETNTSMKPGLLTTDGSSHSPRCSPLGPSPGRRQPRRQPTVQPGARGKACPRLALPATLSSPTIPRETACRPPCPVHRAPVTPVTHSCYGRPCSQARRSPSELCWKETRATDRASCPPVVYEGKGSWPTC